MKNGKTPLVFFRNFLKEKSDETGKEQTNMPENKMGFSNARDLNIAEMTDFYIHFEKAKKIECTYDIEYLCKIHSIIYKDLYDSAGKLRENNYDESMVDYHDIRSEMNDALNKLKNASEMHYPVEFKALGISKFLVDMKTISPFSMGNEEVGIIICKAILDKSGYQKTSHLFFDNEMVAFFDKSVDLLRNNIKEASEKENLSPLQSSVDKVFTHETNNSKGKNRPFTKERNAREGEYSFKKEKNEYSNFVAYNQNDKEFDLSIFCLGYIHYQLNRGEKYAGRFRDTNKIADYVKGAKYKIPDYHEITFHLNEVFKKMENTNLKNLTQEQKTELCKRYLVELLKIHPFEKENVHALTAFVEEWSNEEMIERRGFLKFHNSKDKMEKNVMLAAAEKTKQSISITAIGNGKEIEVDISNNSGAPMTWAGYLMGINKEKKENKETGVKDLKNREEKDR